MRPIDGTSRKREAMERLRFVGFYTRAKASRFNNRGQHGREYRTRRGPDP